MGSLDFALTRQALAENIVVSRATDQAVALRQRYIGDGTVTSVTAVTATSVVNVSTDADTTAHTDTYLFSAYATFGALVDAINADGRFEARVVDVLRSDASDDAILAEAITTMTYDENGDGVFDLKVDTDGMFYVGACLSGNLGFRPRPDGHKVSLVGIDYLANMGTAAADGLRVYARDAKTQGDERLVASFLSVDTTATSVTFGGGLGSIDSRSNEELVVRIKDAASMADGAYMIASGRWE